MSTRFLAGTLLCCFLCGAHMEKSRAFDLHGYGVTETGLRPINPPGFVCSPLTSLYASWKDVDGGDRDEPHTGVDGGRLGEWVLSPAPGVVVRSWKANWGWGDEGALMMMHTREDIGLSKGSKYYYSTFNHLRFNETKKLRDGDVVARGQKLARVDRPGGKEKYLPEVHWEVYEVEDPAALTWHTNRFGRANFKNPTARLVDPLYLLSLANPPNENGEVELRPFLNGKDYRGFQGFTYILPCSKIR